LDRNTEWSLGDFGGWKYGNEDTTICLTTFIDVRIQFEIECGILTHLWICAVGMYSGLFGPFSKCSGQAWLWKEFRACEEVFSLH
jgi:hypothetical protein